MGRSLGFGSIHCDSDALFGLAFAPAPPVHGINLATTNNSLAHYAKGTRSGISLAGHSPSTACEHTVSGALSLPSPGCFSPFPHGTGSLSVVRESLALEGGPPSFPQGFSCPVVLGIPLGCLEISPTRLSRSLAPLSSGVRLSRRIPCRGPTTPRRVTSPRFGLFPVRSPLLRESRLISLPPGTEMFHFPGFAPPRLWIQRRVFRYDSERVAPFGHPRISAC